MKFNTDRDEFIRRMNKWEHITKADIVEWVDRPGNIYYMDDDDIALFNYEMPGLYTGHYFFESRGKKAKWKALYILESFFLCTGAHSIRGLTPVENKAARWMNRQLGFKSYGLIETAPGEFCELFILTRKED